MRIPLVGEDFSSRSPAVSAQTCINVFPSLIDDPNEIPAAQTATSVAMPVGKNRGVLYGCPGKHLFSALSAPPRGYWSGNGRLFAVSGVTLYEISSTGGIISANVINAGSPPANDGLPVGIFVNGNQMMIVTGGFAYLVNDGIHPILITTDNYAGVVNTSENGSGTCNAFGYGVGLVSGTSFVTDGTWNGRTITVNGANYVISTVMSPTQLYTTTSIAVTSPPTYAWSVSAYGTGVAWVSGDQFLTDGTWNGRAIMVGGVSYTISAVDSPTLLFLTATVPINGGSAYSALGLPLTAVCGAYMDDTFFVQRPPGPGPGGAAGSNQGAQVNFSAVLNGLSWNGLDYFTKASYADNLRAIFADGEQLYLLGYEVFEVWGSNPNASASQNPFIRLTGAGGRFGTISTFGVDHIDGHVFFMGGDDRGGPVAYVFNGFSPVRISHHACEAEWKAAGLGPGCVVYCYSEEGHSFMVVNFGTQTWAYEAETGAWHQRAKWSGSAFTPYNTNIHTFVDQWGSDGYHITGCSTGTNNVYRSDISFYDDEGNNICWQRALPYLYNAGLLMFFGRMTLEMETASPSTGTVITYDYSDDRGVTYPNARTTAITTVPAASSCRMFWSRNGKSRGRILRLTGVGQYRVALIDLQIDVTLGVV